MHKLKAIRLRIGKTQQAMASGLGCSQSNIANCERGQTLLPELAERLITYANGCGLPITWDHVYGSAQLPELAQPETKAGEAA